MGVAHTKISALPRSRELCERSSGPARVPGCELSLLQFSGFSLSPNWNTYIPEHEYIASGIQMESEVMKELRLIRRDLKYIRTHMVDQDMILSPEERVLLEESRQDLRAGKTRSLDDVIRTRNGA